MKKKYANCSNFKDIEEKRFKKIRLRGNSEIGTICLTTILKVKKQWEVPRDNGNTEKILDVGYKWVTIYPKKERFAIIAIFDENNEFVEFYFDIAKKVKYKSIVPYIEDLYLDIVMTKDNKVIFLDEDELKKALQTNVIKQEDYEKAKKTADRIVNKFHNQERFDELKVAAIEYLEKLNELKEKK